MKNDRENRTKAQHQNSEGIELIKDEDLMNDGFQHRLGKVRVKSIAEIFLMLLAEL